MPVERRGWVIAFEIGSTGNGRNPIFNGRRQPSCGGTSRMTRECQVRICERLGVKFPGPTRPTRKRLAARTASAHWGEADSNAASAVMRAIDPNRTPVGTDDCVTGLIQPELPAPRSSSAQRASRRQRALRLNTTKPLSRPLLFFLGNEREQVGVDLILMGRGPFRRRA